ncbi:MAG: 3-methylaspartate ammonia-lyase, partial [Rhizobacter sp.]|nr:3-methylaspartate ammonia-lyase [Rhizobacter sp.]
RVGRDAFEVEPISPTSRCTRQTVSAHMLYENSDPFLLHEPGGTLDVTQATYHQLDDRCVQVHGSRFLPAPYTMKLEGAAADGFQTLILVGIRDRTVLASIDRFLAKMQDVLEQRVCTAMGEAAGNFHLSLRAYGWNAVDGGPVDDPGAPPREIGMLFVATAATQELATQIAKTCNPWVFHLPLNEESELPSYAFAFSPAEIERGPVYEFRLNHVVHVDSPSELVRTVFIQAAGAADAHRS